MEGVPERAENGDADRERPGGRRRGRRGRRTYRPADEELPEVAVPGAEQPEIRPAYAGPTPADPFGGHAFDIFDVLERAEEQAVHPSAAPVSGAAAESGPPTLPELVAEPAPPVAHVPGAAPESAEPEPPPPAPVIAPILVGADEPPAARKRGWWRR